jgi:APA family basic amino acid/polyamine antiporter
LVGIPGCIYLFTTLPNLTIGLFFIWNLVGLGVYALFSRRSSVLAKA